MSAKHTPGPWSARRFDESQTVILPDAVDGRQPLIATMSVGHLRPDGEANTRLVVAAPEMRALLERVVKRDPLNDCSAFWDYDAKQLLALIDGEAQEGGQS